MKLSFFLFCYLWFRGTFPRYRYDQLMQLGWKFFLPISIAFIIFYVGVSFSFDLYRVIL